MEIAKHFFFFVGVLGVDVDTDFGLQIRWHFGAPTDEFTGCLLAQMAPFDT